MLRERNAKAGNVRTQINYRRFNMKAEMKNVFVVALVVAGVIAMPGAVLAGGCGGWSKEAKADSSPDIVDTAVKAGSFSTLVAAVKAAGLVDTLKGDGPFTVFAPTDEAFAKLPEGTVENLLKPENVEQLRAVLTYHVVSGKVMAAEVVGLSSAKTVQGPSVTVATEGDTVRIDGAQVVQADIEAANGVIHVIDSVILPSEG
jgi:uncharacterized surface protein with fasciclin (FAS1) repeats